MTQLLKIALLGCAGFAAAGLAGSAEATIACKRGYQLVAGNWLSTPYCQDAYVAAVAREFGVKTSAAAVRNNPNHKRQVCRLIGNDIRIKDSCNEVESEDRARF